MRIDIGSFVFNCDVNQPGSTPSWGTSLGQGAGYKIKEEYNDIMSAMIYNAIKDKENIDCPLGQGGKGIQSGTHEIVIASKFSKVYVNDKHVKGAEFILLIVKEHTDHHDGRLTLKYNKNIKYNAEKNAIYSNINEQCVKAIIKSFDLTEKSAWGVYDISVRNQDELHLSIIVVDDEKECLYSNAEERKDAFDIRIALNNSLLSVEERFKAYLIINKIADTESHMSSILGAFKDVKSIKTLNNKLKLNINSIFDVLDYNLVDKILQYIEINEKELAKESGYENGRLYHGFLRSGLPKYINFLKSIVEERPMYNSIFYGVPGVGKSYRIRKVKNEYYQIRTIFHPEYTNADFIGQLLPVRELNNIDNNENSNKISYSFIPGPFTRILAKALNDSDSKYMLVIDEINRGNAAAIFGEIFQLLDRNQEGRSEYSIHNKDIYDCLIGKYKVDKELLKDGIFIPSNLYIWATMNTSDQNVFTLDTAFQRRWAMEMLPIEYDSEDSNVNRQWNLSIDGSDGLTWKQFVQNINGVISDKMKDMVSTEDKRLGPFFAKENEIKDKNAFVQKVIKYLWDDAFKLSKVNGDIFNKELESFDDIVMKVRKNELKIENIFEPTIKMKFVKDGTNDSINKTEV